MIKLKLQKRKILNKRWWKNNASQCQLPFEVNGCKVFIITGWANQSAKPHCPACTLDLHMQTGVGVPSLELLRNMVHGCAQRQNWEVEYCIYEG